MKWYLSFVKDGEFVGACIVEGVDLGAAITQAWRLGINPGGEVAGIPGVNTGLPENRLLSLEELKSYGPVYRRGDSNVQQIGLN